MRFSGLHLSVSSIIADNEPPVLSGLAPPLSVPGTGFLVYGAMTALAMLIIAVLWTTVWGRRFFARRFSLWKNLRLITLMARFEKHMGKALASGKGSRFILDAVSVEFRNFLSLLTGLNCRAMTPLEFEHFPEVPAGADPWVWPVDFLKRFFRKCDDLRFIGIEAENSDVRVLLGELREFLSVLYKTARERGIRKRHAV
jgi:hypothetical protein